MHNLTRFFAGRPLSVTIVSAFVLSITAWNGIRACIALANWDILSRFNGNPAYIFGTSLAWCIAGMTFFLIISSRKRYSLYAGLILSMIYMIWYWFDRMVIQSSPANNAAFSAVTSIILLMIFNSVLLWPSSRAFFRSARHTSLESPGTRRQDE